MKSQKGMGHIGLIVVIIIIALVIFATLYIANKLIKERKIESLETNMLQVQGKAKIVSEEATMEKKDELLKGRKVENNKDLSIISKLIEEKIISEEEESFSKYYIIDNLDLEGMNLTNIHIDNGYFIVNYDTLEVIYSEGMDIEGKMYYKLSDLEKFSEEKDKEKEKQNEQVTNESQEQKEEKTQEEQENNEEQVVEEENNEG